MNKRAKSELGVTLLEIMLVLAIAAMIIIMSVRYYQSARASQQANTLLQQVQAIIAAADGLAQSNGNYTTVSTALVKPLVPADAMTTPWGEDIEVTGAATSITINTGSVPPAVCPLFYSKLATNSQMTVGGAAADPASCSPDSSTATTITYSANP